MARRGIGIAYRGKHAGQLITTDNQLRSEIIKFAKAGKKCAKVRGCKLTYTKGGKHVKIKRRQIINQKKHVYVGPRGGLYTMDAFGNKKPLTKNLERKIKLKTNPNSHIMFN
jgi:hypothetical protein